MSLIVIANKKVLSISALWELVLKSIFDTENFTFAEESSMQTSIVNWKSAIEIEDEKLAKYQAEDIIRFGKSTIDDHKYTEHKLQIQTMAKMIDDNNKGGLEEKKMFFKRHGICYRKYFRLPNAHTNEDYINGQKALQKSMEEHPEDYE